MPNLHDFSATRQTPRRRNTFDIPFKHLTTGNAGGLNIAYWESVLPGDTFNVKASWVLRMLRTPYVPSMDTAYFSLWFFFVPSRLLWNKFENLVGVAEPDEYTDTPDYVLPGLEVEEWNKVVAGSLANQIGFPVGFHGLIKNPLPIMAYTKIWNDWFRDANLVSSDGTSAWYYQLSSGSHPKGYAVYFFNHIAGSYPESSVMKIHDYFTSALPKPQGIDEPIGINLGGTAKLVADESAGYSLGAKGFLAPLYSDNTLSAEYADGNNSTDPTSTNIFTDLSDVSAVNIEQLRIAIATQSFYEKAARYGFRWTSLLKGFFGVSPRDDTLQRPEYLGGSVKEINLQQVANTSGDGSGTSSMTTAKATGGLGAYSLTSGSGSVFIKSFSEPGYVLGLWAVRVKHKYSQGVHREFNKNTKFDFYWPDFDRLGEQPILSREIYWQAAETDVFGFQEAWSEHRMHPDQIDGAWAPGVSTDLQAWSYGDLYQGQPVLSASWIKEDKSNIDRALTGSTEIPQFGLDIRIDNKATRPISLNSVPNDFGM